MTPLILPLIALMGGFVGALSSAVPLVCIVSSPRLWKKAMFKTIANLSLHESYFLFCCGVAACTNIMDLQVSPAFCAFIQSNNNGMGIGCTIALLILSLERLLTVLYGFRVLVTGWRLTLLLGSSWLGGAGFTGFLFVNNFRRLDAIYGNFTAMPHCQYMALIPVWIRFFSTASILFFYTLIIIVNAIICRIVVRHTRAINQQRRSVDRQLELDDLGAYWGILKIIVINLTVQLPSNVLSVYEIISGDVESVRGLNSATLGLIMVFFGVDGWFFGYYNEELRSRYKSVFCRGKSRPLQLVASAGCAPSQNVTEVHFPMHTAGRASPVASLSGNSTHGLRPTGLRPETSHT